MNGQGDLFGGSQITVDLAAARAERDDTLKRLTMIRRAILDEVDRRLRARLDAAGRKYTNSAEAYEIFQEFAPDIPEVGSLDRRFLGALWLRAHWVNTREMHASSIKEHHATPRPQWAYYPQR